MSTIVVWPGPICPWSIIKVEILDDRLTEGEELVIAYENYDDTIETNSVATDLAENTPECKRVEIDVDFTHILWNSVGYIAVVTIIEQGFIAFLVIKVCRAKRCSIANRITVFLRPEPVDKWQVLAGIIVISNSCLRQLNVFALAYLVLQLAFHSTREIRL